MADEKMEEVFDIPRLEIKGLYSGNVPLVEGKTGAVFLENVPVDRAILIMDCVNHCADLQCQMESLGHSFKYRWKR